MKLDKMRFARLVGHCVAAGMTATDYIIDTMDELIDVEVPFQPQATIKASDVDNLLALMQQGEKKIEAIKAYRMLTSEGLKESKDAVERYWPVDGKKISRDDARVKLKSLALSDEGEYHYAESFIDKLFE